MLRIKMDALAIDPVVARITENSDDGRALREKLRTAYERAGDPLSVQAIFAWRELKGGVPVKRVEIAARVLGMRKSEIRPDIFKPPSAKRGKRPRKSKQALMSA